MFGFGESSQQWFAKPSKLVLTIHNLSADLLLIHQTFEFLSPDARKESIAKLSRYSYTVTTVIQIHANLNLNYWFDFNYLDMDKTKA